MRSSRTPSASTSLAKVDARRFLAVDVAAAAGIVLAAGHADGAVVEQQHGDVAAVVGDVEQALHAHVQEGRIADHGDDALVLVGVAAPLVEAERHAHRGAHRDAGVERVPRVAGAQRVAADVAGDGEVAHLRQRVIDAQVRAGHAHRRRPRKRPAAARSAAFRHRLAKQAGDRRRQHLRRQFAGAAGCPCRCT
jgi:hypothetical protein